MADTESLDNCGQKHRYKKKHTSIFCYFFYISGYPQHREKYLASVLALFFGKFWLVQKCLRCITYFCLTTTYLIGSLPFFLKCVEEFQIDMGIFCISKITKMCNLVISINCANKAPKVSQFFGFFWKSQKHSKLV